jgi:hypothetical protein
MIETEFDALKADVPAQDPHFVLAVMTGIERRRFHHELARTGALAGAAIILLALVMPKIDISWLSTLSQRNEIALAAALMAVTILLPRLVRG